MISSCSNNSFSDEWNRALSQSGESPVKNDKANEQFREHLDSCRTTLRSVIRSILRQHPDVGEFIELDAILSNISCPTEYIENNWVIGFHEVMQIVFYQLNAHLVCFVLKQVRLVLISNHRVAS